MLLRVSGALLPTAIVYDFDGTLAPGNVQEHTLIPEVLGTTVAEFWERVAVEKQEHDADQILIYMRLLLEQARARGRPLTRELLEEHGARIPLFDGVSGWFSRIDAHAAARGLSLEHYVVSSGNEEMIRGSAIARHFKHVFGCRYLYGANGEATWPGTAVNYTTKTQYLFRVNKGVMNHWDNDPVNRWVPMVERPLPFTRMIYMGDGDTDIPSMKMIRHQGGHSIAVFDPAKWEQPAQKSKAYNLIAEDRAHFVVPADYREGSQLDVTLKGVLGRIARDEAHYRERV
ncbi:MAG: HAD family hydrolase [Myxococcota bacterium]